MVSGALSHPIGNAAASHPSILAKRCPKDKIPSGDAVLGLVDNRADAMTPDASWGVDRCCVADRRLAIDELLVSSLSIPTYQQPSQDLPAYGDAARHTQGGRDSAANDVRLVCDVQGY